MTEEQIREALADIYEPKGVDIWLHSRHQWLNGQRAIDLIRRGETAPVEAALQRLTSGAFG